jgi:hypothetical protein
MRAYILATAAAACGGRTVATPRPIVRDTCDTIRWRVYAETSWRARVAGDDVLVIGSRGDAIEVLAKDGKYLVRGIVPVDTLARVVTRETPLRPAPGAAPLFANDAVGTFAEPGSPVSGSGAWLAVKDRDLAVTGFVAADVTGWIWQQPPRRDVDRWFEERAQVLWEPRDGAAQMAEIDRNAPVVERLNERPDGWRFIDARDGQVRVWGWIAPRRGPAPPHTHTYDFSGDTIEEDLLQPEGDPIPCDVECIRREPDDGAEVIGIDRCTGGSRSDGWARVELSTPWGVVVGYRPHVVPDAPWI